MSKTEILAELAHLNADDLAEVRSWLDRLLRDKAAMQFKKPQASPSQIRSPHLANREQAGDFVKHVTELAPDAAV
jgi:hypothetical protein